MRNTLKAGLVLAFVAAVSACGSSLPGSINKAGPGASATTSPVVANRAGKVYTQEITAPNTGDTVVFSVFEPTNLEVGKTYPLVLQGHGYGGSRNVTPDGFQQRLIDAGYYVISIDQRGFGDSSGTVRVMDPDFEGQDLVAILDWAEALEGLRRGADGKMVVGSYGGSYGGMYQFLLMGTDPAQRLHIIAPDITPHDLNYALNPNNVVKSGYGLLLSAAAELSPRFTSLRQDPAIFETLGNAVLSNSFPEAGKNFFAYHSVRYFCDGLPAGPQNFVLATPDPLAVPPRPFPKVDALITQGSRDTLFNMNDGFNNYQCLKALGGDVRFLTHESGHILPVSLTSIPGGAAGTAEDVLDPFYTALTLPNFQDTGGSRNCGTLNLQEVQFAWLEEKLQNKSGEIDKALPIGKDVCLSLGKDDAVATHEVKKGGLEFVLDSAIPQFNSVLGVLGGTVGDGVREVILATQPIATAPAGGMILAGFPTMSLQVDPVGFGLDECPLAPLNLAACDPILFLAIGHRKAGAARWDIIDDQLTPIRGFGLHEGSMSGIGERIPEGDDVALLVLGFHAQYPVTWSRDLFVPAMNVSGKVSLPVLDKSEIVRDGV